MITDEMERYLKRLFSNNETHPVLFAAEAHTRFVSIHPFVDGNGRTARLIMNLVLIHYRFPPAVIKLAQRAEYLDSIENWQQQNAHVNFELLRIDSVRKSLELYLETLEKNVIGK